jgi:DNA primase
MSRYMTPASLPPDPSFVKTYGIRTPKGWYRLNCPQCGDTNGKLYVNLENSFYKCFRGCVKKYFDGKGLSAFGVQMSESLQKTEKDKFDFPRISLENESFEANLIKGYLDSRGLEEHVRRVFEIEGAVVFNNFAVALPVITPLRRTPYWYYRIIGNPEFKHYSEFPKRELLYGHPRVLTAKSLYIMEGTFDILCSLPFSSVCSYSKIITDEQLGLLKYFTCEEILVCLDGSVDFKRKLRSLLRVKIETGRRVGIVKLPEGKDPANIGPVIKDLDREYI